MRIGVIYFTEKGELVAKNVIAMQENQWVLYEKSKQTAKEFVKECFEMEAIIFVGAVGIAVRLIAPHIKTKDIDPAVIVVDDLGQHVIPLLSGHLGGANKLAGDIAKHLSGTPIITTATDLNNKFAVDVWSKNHNCVISDIGKIKYVSSVLLHNQTVGFKSDFECINELPEGLVEKGNTKVGIRVSLGEDDGGYEIALNVIPKIVTIGVGCKKNTKPKDFEEYVLDTLEEQNISLKAVKQLASIDLKKEEECIKLFSEKYKIPFCTYSVMELSTIPSQFTASEFVKKTTGVDNVCERSAMYKSDGELLLKKHSKNGITIAISREKWRCEF